MDLLGIEAARYGGISEVHRFRLLANEQYARHVISLHFLVSQGELRFIRNVARVSAEQASRADVRRCYLRPGSWPPPKLLLG
jgi:hypothetical protein